MELKTYSIMKKKIYPLLLVAALSMTACTDITEPTVDYGGNTFINDYSSLVDAVNNLTHYNSASMPSTDCCRTAWQTSSCL